MNLQCLIVLRLLCQSIICNIIFKNRHTDGIETYEHRELHNLNGLLTVKATYSGLKARSELRPFILTRSFFAGSQRYAAVWTGDCQGSWDHLKLNIGMLQNLCTVGINFCGSDIPGFFGDPSNNLLIRWYQASVFFPFMRAHAHHKTKRREPWILPIALLTKIKRSITKRYTLLPYIYTMFYKCYCRPCPFMIPLWMISKDPIFDDIEDEYMFGTSLLVRPIYSDKEAVKVILPKHETWYEFQTGKIMDSNEFSYIENELEDIPVFIKGGSILPLYEFDSIRSTMDLKTFPISLLIAPDNKGNAKGYLYLDNGETFNYQTGEFTLVKFEYENSKLKSKIIKNGYYTKNYYQKITILNIINYPKKLKTGEVIQCIEYDEWHKKLMLILVNDAVKMINELEIVIE